MNMPGRYSNALAIVLCALLLCGGSEAASPAKLGKASIAHAVAQSSTRRVLAIVGGDRAANQGLVRMVAYAASQGTADKDLIRSIGRAVEKLEREVGRAQARQFLADFNAIAAWARGQPAVRQEELKNLVRDFTRTRSRTFTGAYYELHLAAHFIKNPPPHLQRLQPKTLSDNQLFRDFVVRMPSGELAYVEAKNWQHIYNKTAIRKLRRQVDSHFTRLRQPPPEPLLNVPPGKALVFYFNTRARGPSVRADWVDAIRQQAVQTLQIPPPKGYGFSRQNAETWVSQHLSIEEVVFARH